MKKTIPGQVVVIFLASFMLASCGSQGDTNSAVNQYATSGPDSGYLVIVGGNMKDRAITDKFIELAGGNDSLIVVIPTASGEKNIDNKVEKFNNLIFSGLEGSKLYNYGEHQYSENQMKEKIARLFPKLFIRKLKDGRYLDVLVTHAPPWKIHDKDDPAHQGFKSFLSFIESKLMYAPKTCRFPFKAVS